MAHGMDHAAQRLGVGLLDRLAEAAQDDRPQRVALTAVRAVGRLDLGDDERSHADLPSTEVSAPGAAVSPVTEGASSPLVEATGGSTTGGLPPRPRTLSTDRPRRGAISSGLRRSWRPAIVALTRLIGFCEPRDFDRMSWMAASPRNARP